MKEKTLEYVEINPAQPPLGTVIWLHGLGASGNDFLPVINQLNLSNQLNLRFVFPHAPHRPITVNQGYVMRAWYDIQAMTTDAYVDHVSIEDSVSQVGKLIEQETSNKVWVAGFSQGAVIALAALLKFPKKLEGIIALSGYLPPSLLEKTNKANQDTPVFLAHGKEDTIVPYEWGEQACQQLKKHHYSVDWHSYSIPHTVSYPEIQDIKNWLIKSSRR